MAANLQKLLVSTKELRGKYKAAAAGGGDVQAIKQDITKIEESLTGAGLLKENLQAYCTSVKAEIEMYEKAQDAQEKIVFWQERNRILTAIEGGMLPEDLAKLSGVAFDEKIETLFSEDEINMLFNPQDKFDDNKDLKAKLLGWDPKEFERFEKENPGKIANKVDLNAIAPVALYTMEGEKKIRELKKTPKIELGAVHNKVLALLAKIVEVVESLAKKLPPAPFGTKQHAVDVPEMKVKRDTSNRL